MGTPDGIYHHLIVCSQNYCKDGRVQGRDTEPILSLNALRNPQVIGCVGRKYDSMMAVHVIFVTPLDGIFLDRNSPTRKKPLISERLHARFGKGYA
jgi:hypothetical protein